VEFGLGLFGELEWSVDRLRFEVVLSRSCYIVAFLGLFCGCLKRQKPPPKVEHVVCKSLPGRCCTPRYISNAYAQHIAAWQSRAELIHAASIRSSK
jgi:hypothetical protein